MDANNLIPKLTYVSLEKAQNPTGHFHWDLWEDRYWVVHPEKGVAFYDPQGRGRRISPQCNSNPKIMERMAPDGHEIRLIEKVWVPHDCRDYVC